MIIHSLSRLSPIISPLYYQFCWLDIFPFISPCISDHVQLTHPGSWLNPIYIMIIFSWLDPIYRNHHVSQFNPIKLSCFLLKSHPVFRSNLKSPVFLVQSHDTNSNGEISEIPNLGSHWSPLSPGEAFPRHAARGGGLRGHGAPRQRAAHRGGLAAKQRAATLSARPGVVGSLPNMGGS
jgi:hypothetical protein